MLRQLDYSIYKEEKPGIFLRKEGQEQALYASQFTEQDFARVCSSVGMNRSDISKVMEAYGKNRELMAGNRRSGEPNWHHPVGVALVQMLEFGESDPDHIIAALMHDSVEDSDFFTKNGDPLEELTDLYGEKVAKMVMAVTKPESSILKSDMSPEERHSYLKRKFYKVIESYPEVKKEACELKIADRIFNLRTEIKNDRLVRKLDDTMRYLYPVAPHANIKYHLALYGVCNELRAKYSLI